MFLILPVLYLFIGLNCKAEALQIINAKISEIHQGYKNQSSLIFLSNGTVTKVLPSQKKLLEDLFLAQRNGLALKINVLPSRVINNFEYVMTSAETFFSSNQFYQEEYRPSIVENLSRAQELFNQSRKNHKESQCFNRAHIWTYEWRKKEDIFSSKIWLFFTLKYIRKYDFDWWFHVAPLLQVIEYNRVKDRVADMKYAKGPLPIKMWTDIFMRNNSDCPRVQKYSDQANYPESSWCYIMKSPMYYYQPVDLENIEKTGEIKNSWNPTEVRDAYKDAFDIDI